MKKIILYFVVFWMPMFFLVPSTNASAIKQKHKVYKYHKPCKTWLHLKYIYQQGIIDHDRIAHGTAFPALIPQGYGK